MVLGNNLWTLSYPPGNRSCVIRGGQSQDGIVQAVYYSPCRYIRYSVIVTMSTEGLRGRRSLLRLMPTTTTPFLRPHLCPAWLCFPTRPWKKYSCTYLARMSLRCQRYGESGPLPGGLLTFLYDLGQPALSRPRSHIVFPTAPVRYFRHRPDR